MIQAASLSGARSLAVQGDVAFWALASFAAPLALSQFSPSARESRPVDRSVRVCTRPVGIVLVRNALPSGTYVPRETIVDGRSWCESLVPRHELEPAGLTGGPSAEVGAYVVYGGGGR